LKDRIEKEKKAAKLELLKEKADQKAVPVPNVKGRFTIVEKE
jgi:hypothetical protein